MTLSIGKKIKELLNDRLLTQKQMAEALRLPATTLSGYIRDFREPDIGTLKIIAGYFNVTMDYLLEYNSSTLSNNEKELNTNEVKLLSVYRSLNKEQQELLIEHGLVYIKINSKKIAESSNTTSKKGTGKTSG
jgi:transcriptional regulator with XRE-family HTH domain